MKGLSKNRKNLLVVSFLLLGACSGIKVAYYFLDNLLQRELLPYLNDDSTRDLAKRQIVAFKHWHQKAMLSKYSAFLRKVSISDLSQPAVDAHFEEGTRLWEETIVGGMRYMAVVLEQHTSSQQLKHMRRAIAKAQVERLKKASRPLKKRVEENSQKAVEGFERFTGELKQKQRTIIRRHLTVMSGSTPLWLKGQQSRQAALLILLAQRPKRSELESFLRRLVLKPETFGEPGYWERLQAIRRRIRRMTYEVLAAMDAKQLAHFRKTLLGYANDLDALSK